MFQQEPIDPRLTMVLTQASMAAYSDFEGEKFEPPPGYVCVARWTGWDNWTLDRGQLGGGEERYGLLFRSESKPVTYIFAFRGTDSDMDEYEDLFWDTVEFVPTNTAPPQPAPYVASGFYGVYNESGGNGTTSMREQVFALLHDCKPARIYITGHSLGAALSQLFALDVVLSERTTDVFNMNFASPRVGTNNWKLQYERHPTLSKTRRIYNSYDWVPTLPPSLLDYTHVGVGFRTAFRVCNAYLPHELSRHSLANLQTVLGHAVKSNPQVWVGSFKDAAAPNWKMCSTQPPSVDDYARWKAKVGDLCAFEQSLRQHADDDPAARSSPPAAG
jgi:hypothetical protein